MINREVRIIDSVNSLKAKFDFIARDLVDKRMRSYAPVISRKVGELIGDALIRTPEAQSILTGQLKADFGLTDTQASSSLEQLIEAVKRSTTVKLNIKPTGGVKYAYAMVVSILPAGLSSVLSTIGTYTSENSGKDIAWMEWLLTRGVEVVVDDAFVIYGNKPSSRSGMAVMAQSGGSGRMFRVDPQYAGTADDNFVTKTIGSLLPEIGLIMRSYL